METTIENMEEWQRKGHAFKVADVVDKTEICKIINVVGEEYGELYHAFTFGGLDLSDEGRRTSNQCFYSEITSTLDAVVWMLALVRDGKDFHFDDNPSDIIDENGDRLFYGTSNLVSKRVQEWRSFGGWDLFEHSDYGQILCMAYDLTYGEGY
jgi:hypothetical protein